MSTSDARERILQSALELIARDGFDGVRLADIAQGAGVSTALLHYHFASRAQLLTDALAQSLSAAERRLEHRTADARRTRADQRFADLIDFGLPLTPEDVLEWRLWAELEHRASGSPELARSLAALNDRLLRPLAAAVASGLEEGQFSGCDPDDVATVALALLGGLATRLSAGDPGLSVGRARRLAGRQLALAVGYEGELPFQPLPPLPPAPAAAPSSASVEGAPIARRRRAPKASARP
ncbi:TetR/AcrR family transcriptional regulator [Cryptosporangium phraense]|uniref:TetR family transcriptional regulator n=1 Tax=Cryptosporangium phraense TaxID=2593070 RepID=A0A545B0C3_9ACTN|nr:TetR/AcrR family transcriptional regulator [Cryptosporangium phraense]TQS47021.1 TetR family transcriptional regulator [Cryptosporangium phraense]